METIHKSNVRVRAAPPGSEDADAWSMLSKLLMLEADPLFSHGKLGQTLGPESDKYPNMNRNIEMTN